MVGGHVNCSTDARRRHDDGHAEENMELQIWRTSEEIGETGLSDKELAAITGGHMGGLAIDFDHEAEAFVDAGVDFGLYLAQARGRSL